VRVLLVHAGDDRFAFEALQLSRVLPWPLEADLPWGSLCALVGSPAAEPEPRAMAGWSAASGAPFALRVPGPLSELDVSDPEVLLLPPLLSAPPWVRGLVLPGDAPALLLDLPSLGDLILAAAGPPAATPPESRT
jgi:hypothetical protein